MEENFNPKTSQEDGRYRLLHPPNMVLSSWLPHHQPQEECTILTVINLIRFFPGLPTVPEYADEASANTLPWPGVQTTQVLPRGPAHLPRGIKTPFLPINRTSSLKLFFGVYCFAVCSLLTKALHCTHMAQLIFHPYTPVQGTEGWLSLGEKRTQRHDSSYTLFFSLDFTVKIKMLLKENAFSDFWR